MKEPIFLHYEQLVTRLRSYRQYRWPGNTADLYIMAVSGFFYVGVRDITICYHCGLALTGWNEILSNTPIHEHLFYNPECIVAANKMANLPVRYIAYTRTAIMSNTEEFIVLYSKFTDEVARLQREEKQFIDMLANFETVRRVNATVIARRTRLYSYCKVLMASLAYSDETDDLEQAAMSAKVTLDLLQNCTNDYITEPIGAYAHETPRSESQLECVVCYDNRSTVLFLPCRHLICCGSCAPRLKQFCPLCRSIIWFHVNCIY